MKNKIGKINIVMLFSLLLPTAIGSLEMYNLKAETASSSEYDGVVIEGENEATISLQEKSAQKKSASTDVVPVLSSTYQDEQTVEASVYEVDLATADQTVLKRDENAGILNLELQNSVDGVYTVVDSKLVLKSEEIKYNDENEIIVDENSQEIVVVNNLVVAASNSIVTSIGGYDDVNYMYESIEQLQANEQPIPINGGALEGSYTKTVKVDDQYYVYVNFGGHDGIMKIGDVQIVPVEFLQAQSNYVVEDGVTYLYEAVDPLTSTTYEVLPTSIDIPEAAPGVKYYSTDGETFYETKTLKNSRALSGTNYFKQLSFRSSSRYTASQYKSYLNSIGKTNSKYYDSTAAFVQAQEELGINSLMLFAMANHEGAYGTSYFSNQCNNFFGRGAFDSNPDNACIEYGYDDAKSGILAQGIFISNNYADTEDWVYTGLQFGDKNGGMNVYYASDTQWGQKIASHVASIDSYLGGKEDSQYRIIKLNSEARIYTSSDLTNGVLYKDAFTGENTAYSFPVNNGKTPNLVVVAETSNAFKVQVDTAVYKGSSSELKWTAAKKGTYPSFNNSWNTAQVAKGYAGFPVKYDSFKNNQYWISKSNYQNINNVTMVSPVNQASSLEYADIPENCTIKVSSSTTSGVLTENYKDAAGYETCVVKTKNGTIASIAHKVYYDTANKKLKMNSYTTTSGIYKAQTTTERWSTSTKKIAKTVNNYKNGVRTSYIEYEYSNGNWTGVSNTYDYATNGNKTLRTKRTYDSKGKVVNIVEYNYTNGKFNNISTERKLNATGGTVVKYKRTYNDSGRLLEIVEYEYKNGKFNNVSTERKFNSSNTTSAKTKRTYDADSGNLTNDVYYYYKNGVFSNKSVQTFYRSNGSISKKVTRTYKSDGSVASVDTVKY